MIQRENQTFKKLQILEILNVFYDFWKSTKKLITLHHGDPTETTCTAPSRLSPGETGVTEALGWWPRGPSRGAMLLVSIGPPRRNVTRYPYI